MGLQHLTQELLDAPGCTCVHLPGRDPLVDVGDLCDQPVVKHPIGGGRGLLQSPGGQAHRAADLLQLGRHGRAVGRPATIGTSLKSVTL